MNLNGLKKLETVKILSQNSLKQYWYIPHPDIKGYRNAFIESQEVADIQAVPRWMVLDALNTSRSAALFNQAEAEFSFLQYHLGVTGDPREINDAEKLAILGRAAGVETPVAESGIAFLNEYRQFEKTTLAPLLDQCSQFNIKDLSITFRLEGIVQKCGTRGLISRLVKMINPAMAQIDFPKDTDVNHQSVSLRADLFTFAILAGLTKGQTFHAVDLGWQYLPPHNFIAYKRSSLNPSVPRAMHIYTVQFDAFSPEDYFGYFNALFPSADRAGLDGAEKIAVGTHEFINNLWES